MTLSSLVNIAGRFQRAIRIDTDMHSEDALEGFICPASSAEVLRSTVRHISTDQCAFTWTGPYGSGKSSLAIALISVLRGARKNRTAAAKILGEEIADELWKTLPPKPSGWHILPVVGQRADPIDVIGKAIEQEKMGSPDGEHWTQNDITETLINISESSNRHGGLLVVID